MKEEKLPRRTLLEGSDFSTLDIDRIGKVVLAYGPNSKIEVECPAEQLSTIKAKRSGSKVSIRSKKSVAVNNSTLYITVNSNHLNLTANMVGRIESEGTISVAILEIEGSSIGSINLNLKSDKISLKGKAFGEVVLAGTANNSKFKIEAISSLNCAELALAGAQVHMKASQNIDLNVSTFLELDLHACPHVSLIGEPTVTVLNKDPQVAIEKIR